VLRRTPGHPDNHTRTRRPGVAVGHPDGPLFIGVRPSRCPLCLHGGCCSCCPSRCGLQDGSTPSSTLAALAPDPTPKKGVSVADRPAGRGQHGRGGPAGPATTAPAAESDLYAYHGMHNRPRWLHRTCRLFATPPAAFLWWRKGWRSGPRASCRRSAPRPDRRRRRYNDSVRPAAVPAAQGPLFPARDPAMKLRRRLDAPEAALLQRPFPSVVPKWRNPNERLS
jgi:hypothetical protein